MPPIRVAIVGLSSSAKAGWAATGHLPYLQSSEGKKHYQVVALLNSSVAAAESAKAAFNIPDAKAYGEPADLAADPDVDLVVVTTRADVHFSVVESSIRAKKAVYIEWPLTHDLASSLELTKDLPTPSDTIVGLQGRVAPITLRLKELLASGTVGKVLSSEVRTYGNVMPRDALPETFAYFADKKVGGHPFNIHYGHTIDYVHEVLGDWETLSSQLQIQRPELRGLGENTRTIKTDVPDFVSAHGTLKPNRGVTVPGATLTATFRVGPQFPGTPGFVWTINGETGELRVTASGPFLFSGFSFDAPVTIEHHDYATDEVKDLGWSWPESQRDLPLASRSVAGLYERYAEWVEGGRSDVGESRNWPRLEDGLALMKEFDGMYKQYDPEW